MVNQNWATYFATKMTMGSTLIMFIGSTAHVLIFLESLLSKLFSALVSQIFVWWNVTITFKAILVIAIFCTWSFGCIDCCCEGCKSCCGRLPSFDQEMIPKIRSAPVVGLKKFWKSLKDWLWLGSDRPKYNPVCASDFSADVNENIKNLQAAINGNSNDVPASCSNRWKTDWIELTIISYLYSFILNKRIYDTESRFP